MEERERGHFSATIHAPSCVNLIRTVKVKLFTRHFNYDPNQNVHLHVYIGCDGVYGIHAWNRVVIGWFEVTSDPSILPPTRDPSILPPTRDPSILPPTSDPSILQHSQLIAKQPEQPACIL